MRKTWVDAVDLARRWDIGWDRAPQNAIAALDVLAVIAVEGWIPHLCGMGYQPQLTGWQVPQRGDLAFDISAHVDTPHTLDELFEAALALIEVRKGAPLSGKK